MLDPATHTPAQIWLVTTIWEGVIDAASPKLTTDERDEMCDRLAGLDSEMAVALAVNALCTLFSELEKREPGVYERLMVESRDRIAVLRASLAGNHAG